MRPRRAAALCLLLLLPAAPVLAADPGVPASAAVDAHVVWDVARGVGVSHRTGGLVPTESGGVRLAYPPETLLEPADGTRLEVGRHVLVPGGAEGAPVVGALAGGLCSSTSSGLRAGHVDVRDVAYDEAGHLVRLAADAALDCGGSTPVLQVRLGSDVPYASISSRGTGGTAWRDSPAAVQATFTNDGTTPVLPGDAQVEGAYGSEPVPGTGVVRDGCAGAALPPGASCTVEAAVPPHGAVVRLPVPELDGLGPAREGLAPVAAQRVDVGLVERPAPVIEVRAAPAVDGVLVAWQPAPGSGPQWYVVERRSADGSWVRLTEPRSTWTTTWADRGAPVGATSTYRVVPGNAGGEDLSGARLSGAAGPLDGWAPPRGAATYASLDGAPPVTDGLAVTPWSWTIPVVDGRPGLTVPARGTGWSLGTRRVDAAWTPPESWRSSSSVDATLTVTRLAVRADGTPVELAASVVGTLGDGTPVRAVLVLGSVPDGLPAHVVATPGVVRTPVPDGMDQTWPVLLRNVGGSATTLSDVAVTSRLVTPVQPTVWTAARTCTGTLLAPGAECRTSVRARQSALDPRYVLGRAEWTGPDGQRTGVDLDGSYPGPGAPTVTLSAPAHVLASAVVQVGATDPQPGDRLQRHCRLDSGPFTPCGPTWSLTGLTRGVHVVTAYATDPAGGMSAWVRASLTADGVGGRDRLATVGRDGALHGTDSPATPFVRLGGVLVDAPVSAGSGTSTWTVGVGSDRNLYVRTPLLGWKRLTPAGTRCTGPSVALSGRTLAVACRGADGQLYVGRATVRAGELPQVARLVRRGGALLYGTATAVLPGGGFSYTVVGTDHALYTTGDSGGFTRLPGSLRCYGSPGNDSVTTRGLACRSSTGALQAVLDRATGAHRVVGGVMVGRPGVAVDPDGSSRFYVLGTDRGLWTASMTPGGEVSGFRRGPAGSWSHGVSAGARP